ncbi:MAG: hypothetical protein SFV54_04620 [Bryobacteraceae bacterium]|nr:hypothetical protein [Bryobacteraceae bacterium]
MTWLLVVLLSATGEQTPAIKGDDRPAQPPREAGTERTQLNLLGQTDTRSGESRRNENVQFNLIDNNALKELNQRIGTSATVITEFLPGRNYFGAEFGQTPPAPFLAAPVSPSAWRGRLTWTHLNSVTSARAFFQVGPVRPARENQLALEGGGRLWRGAYFTSTGSLQRIRGMVNGNILAPLASERTPLTTDPAKRAYVQRILDAYPALLPNRTDIDIRMVNLNAPQRVSNDNVAPRLEQRLTDRDTAVFSYSFLAQRVLAFQLLKGQNPDTTTRAHTAAVTWNRAWSARTVSQVGFRFDRATIQLVPENNNLGPQIFISNVLTQINPQNAIPTDRAQNNWRTAAQLRRTGGRHSVTLGFETIRRQLNGTESDAHLGALSFNNNYGNDAITNLRLGLPTTWFLSVGDIGRGFRYWEHWFYAADKWSPRANLTIQYGAGYRPITRPVEVNNRNRLPYYSDWNNVGPFAGIAWRPAGVRLGVFRATAGLHYGEIFPVTFQQVRFNAPGNIKQVIMDPDLLIAVRPPTPVDPTRLPRTVLYDYQENLVSPYSGQYGLSWEMEPRRNWRWQLGYTGSRSVKLLHHWFFNRGHAVPGIPLTTGTIDARRANPNHVDIRRVTNGSRAFFDAFRTSLLVTSWRGLSLDASYWLSKAIDLGGDYTNVAHDNDSFRFRSQSEFDVHRDMKARSRFDQPHAGLVRVSYALPKPSGRARRLGTWTLNSVILAKSGTTFNLQTGSDAPGFGNVDGIGGDRPNIIDPSVLGRAIRHPDVSRSLMPRAAFAFVRPGEERGNMGRNVLRRAPIRNWNAGLTGEFGLRGERRLRVGGEAVNLTNTPQFAEPGASLTDTNFGAITNTLNDGRSFRFQISVAF